MLRWVLVIDNEIRDANADEALQGLSVSGTDFGGHSPETCHERLNRTAMRGSESIFLQQDEVSSTGSSGHTSGQSDETSDYTDGSSGAHEMSPFVSTDSHANSWTWPDDSSLVSEFITASESGLGSASGFVPSRYSATSHSSYTSDGLSWGTNTHMSGSDASLSLSGSFAPGNKAVGIGKEAWPHGNEKRGSALTAKNASLAHLKRPLRNSLVSEKIEEAAAVSTVSGGGDEEDLKLREQIMLQFGMQDLQGLKIFSAQDGYDRDREENGLEEVGEGKVGDFMDEITEEAEVQISVENYDPRFVLCVFIMPLCQM